jgi:hypothetical protein
VRGSSRLSIAKTTTPESPLLPPGSRKQRGKILGQCSAPVDTVKLKTPAGHRTGDRPLAAFERCGAPVLMTGVASRSATSRFEIMAAFLSASRGADFCFLGFAERFLDNADGSLHDRRAATTALAACFLSIIPASSNE